MPVSLSVCAFGHLFVCLLPLQLSVQLSVCLSVHHPSSCLSVWLSIHLSVPLAVSLSVCLPAWLTAYLSLVLSMKSRTSSVLNMYFITACSQAFNIFERYWNAWSYYETCLTMIHNIFKVRGWFCWFSSSPSNPPCPLRHSSALSTVKKWNSQENGWIWEV